MDTPEQTIAVTIRFPIELLHQIDNHRRESRYRPTRSAAIRALIEEGLSTMTPQKIAIVRPRS